MTFTSSAKAWLRVGKYGGPRHLVIAQNAETGEVLTACGLRRSDVRSPAGAMVCVVCASTEDGRLALAQEQYRARQSFRLTPRRGVR